MAKESFDNINSAKKDTGVNEGAALSAIEHSKENGQKKRPVSKQEQEARKEALKTQGIKGCKLPRVNMAFTPDNHRFIRVMSKITGLTMAEVVNNIVSQYKTEHADMFKKANEVYAEFIGDNDDV